MVGGQMLDLAGEGRFGDREPVDVARLQQMKTGALLRYGCIAGAILGQSSQKEYQALDDYGRALGEAFQIADDLLDVEGDAAALGKQTGQDAALGKTTFVTQLGIDGRQAARARSAGARRFRALDLRRQGRGAARRRAISSPNARIEGADGGQGSRRSHSSPLPEDVEAGPRGLCAAAHLHFDPDRNRGVLSAAGFAAAGDASADRLGRLHRAVSAARLHHDVAQRPDAYPAQRGAAGRRPLSDPAGDRARRVRQHRRDRVRARRIAPQRAATDAGDGDDRAVVGGGAHHLRAALRP